MKIIAKNLKSLLAAKSMTARDFATKVNMVQNSLGFDLSPINEKTIYYYYQGVTPPLNRRYIISGLLGVPMNKLWVLSEADPGMVKIVAEEIKNLKL